MFARHLAPVGGNFLVCKAIKNSPVPLYFFCYFLGISCRSSFVKHMLNKMRISFFSCGLINSSISYCKCNTNNRNIPLFKQDCHAVCKNFPVKLRFHKKKNKKKKLKLIFFFYKKNFSSFFLYI